MWKRSNNYSCITVSVQKANATCVLGTYLDVGVGARVWVNVVAAFFYHNPPNPEPHHPQFQLLGWWPGLVGVHFSLILLGHRVCLTERVLKSKKLLQNKLVTTQLHGSTVIKIFNR